jgi:mRNA interferase MazF
VLHDSGRYPDTAVSVVIGDPLPCTAVAVNIVQLRTERFDGAKLLGPVDAGAMTRVDAALRAVQDL